MRINFGNIKIRKKINLGNVKLGIKKVYPELEDIEITPSGVEQHFKSENYYGYDEIKVKAVESETLEVKPTEEEQQFIGLYGTVNIDKIPSEYVVPTGTKDITENGTHNVKEYQEVNVDVVDNSLAELVSGTLVDFVAPVGTKKIKRNLFYYDETIQTADLRNVEGELGTEAFRNATNLVSVIMPENLTDYSPFGARCFTNCSALKSFEYLGQGSATSSTPAIFNGCIALETVYMPKFNFSNSLQTFINCSKLKRVEIKASGLGANFFNNCAVLETLILNRNNTTVATLSSIYNFSATPIESGTGYIYVPKATIEQYKVATNWSTFASQFRAIEDYPEICGEVE